MFESDAASIELFSRYQKMVQSQDDELTACIAHLHPIFESLKLIGKNVNSNTSREKSLVMFNDNMTSIPKSNYQVEKKNSYSSSRILLSDMKRALLKLERPCSAEEKFISSDKQFMMALQKICNSSKKELFFLEFLHCYKTVVSGMLIMQTSTQEKGQHSKEDEVTFHEELRSMTRKRVLAMLNVFEREKQTETVAKCDTDPKPILSAPRDSKARSNRFKILIKTVPILACLGILCYGVFFDKSFFRVSTQDFIPIVSEASSARPTLAISDPPVYQETNLKEVLASVQSEIQQFRQEQTEQVTYIKNCNNDVARNKNRLMIVARSILLLKAFYEEQQKMDLNLQQVPNKLRRSLTLRDTVTRTISQANFITFYV